MRRGLSLAMALLLALALCPMADAASGKGEGKGKQKSDDGRSGGGDPEGGASETFSSAMEPFEEAFDDVPVPIGVALLGFGGAGMLVVAAWAGRSAMRPRNRRPPRKSFHAGRGRGIREGMERAHAPLDALRQADLGETSTTPIPGGGHRVVLKRTRGTPCEYAAGYLTGLFEGAWADDVRVEHPACAGKDKHASCVYDVVRARPVAAAPPPAPHASPVGVRPGPPARGPIAAGGPAGGAATRR